MRTGVIWGLILMTTVPYLFFIPFSTGGWWLYLAAVTGYVGFSLMIWGLVLGTRSVGGLFDHDLVAQARVHRWLGEYGAWLTLSHPVWTVLGLNFGLSYIWQLDTSSSFGWAVTWGRLAIFGLLVIWIGSVLVRRWFSYRAWKAWHYLNYLLIVFAAIHIYGAQTLFTHPGVHLIWLTMVWVGLVGMLLRIASWLGFGQLSYRVVASVEVAPGVARTTLAPVGRWLESEPGQFVYLRPIFAADSHPLSVLEYDAATGRLTVLYNVYGKFTRALAGSAAGDVVLVDGPYGEFTREASDKSLTGERVYVAGGIGIVPFYEQIKAHPSKSRLIWATRTVELAPLRDDFRTWLGDRFSLVVSRQDKVPADVLTGRVDADLMRRLLPNAAEKLYFLCGPGPQMAASREALLAIGVPAERIFSEGFSL